MADDLKRVGLVFKADGTVDFKKSLMGVTNAVKENEAEFKKLNLRGMIRLHRWTS
jgi:hypothetical protein